MPSEYNPKFNPDDETKEFLKLTNWKLREIKLFNKYLLNYERTYNFKKLLDSMIKFEEMYQPIRKSSTYIDPTSYIKSLNEERKFKRYEISLNKKDLINTVDVKGERRLVVTSRGHKIFYKDYPLARLRYEKWDGIWTIVMYDIPEKKANIRKYFRAKLMALGFGTPQISILASPLPLSNAAQQLIEGENLKKMVWVMKAKGILGMKNREVAEKAWVLEELNTLYRLLLKILPKIKYKKEKDNLKNVWKHYFLSVSAGDPHLPFELLPKDWLGEKCRKEFLSLGRHGLFGSIFRNLY